MNNNTLHPLQRSRVKYLDTLRGFTMLLVVYQHIRYFTLGNLPIEDSAIALFFIAFRMPMFFFISGYIAYKTLNYWSFENYRKRLITKMRVQLIPTIIFWSVFKYFQIRNWGFPGGFWFTEVLFEMFCIYFTVALLSKLVSSKIEEIFLICFALILFFIKGKFAIYPNLEFLQLTELSRYFIFFILGLFCRKYNNGFIALTGNKYVLTLCILTPLFLLSIVYGPLKFPLERGLAGLVSLVNGICLVIVIFTMFRKSENYWNKDGATQRCLEYIGRRTLDIYMLHYSTCPSRSSPLHKECTFC